MEHNTEVQQIAYLINKLETEYNYSISFSREGKWADSMPNNTHWHFIDREDLLNNKDVIVRLNGLIYCEEQIKKITELKNENKGNVK